jgi:hypothetical protein
MESNPVFSVFLYSTCKDEVIYMTIKFNNYSKSTEKRDDREWYHWKVYVDENDSILDKIDYVTYYLHPSFPVPVQTIFDRRSKFALEALGWGSFDMSMTIFFKDGSEVAEKYYLDIYKIWPEEKKGEDLFSILRPSADLRNAELQDKKLIGVDLHNADLRQANFSGADLTGANLSSANLMRAELNSSILRKANLSGSDMRLAKLWYADLEEANFKDAKMNEIQLYSANLRKANLEGAILLNSGLMRAKLEGAILKNADLRGTTFKDSLFDENTSLIGVEYDQVTIDNLPGSAIKAAMNDELRDKLSKRHTTL